MNSIIRKILETIENKGFEAYIVGGFVRDYILGISSNDVDIATNALLKDLKEIFKIGKCDTNNYGSFKIQTKKYNFDITTYREEFKYKNRKPTEINYVNNLLVDLNRRDFTINSLCMNSKGTIIDVLDGKKDILDKKIRVIGKISTKFNEDPLRMLRALRFAITLGFTIEEKALEYIINHKSKLTELTYSRKKSELELILLSDNVIIGLEYLKRIGILEALEINFQRAVKVNNLLGMWAQLEFSDNYSFSRSELKTINTIKSITSCGRIDEQVLFDNEIYNCLVAGEILGLNKKDIYDKYKKMPIHTNDDVKISSQDIIHFLNIQPSSVIKKIKNDVVTSILSKELINKKSAIKKHIIANREKWLNDKKCF